MMIFFMMAFLISLGAPLIEDRYLGIGAIGFPLFSVSSVFLHTTEITPVGALFAYAGLIVASFGTACLLLSWKREPFAGIVLSTLGALFYALPLEGESMTAFFAAVLVMLFIGLWLTHQHLDKSHHMTKQ